jgi:hypothetical protein
MGAEVTYATLMQSSKPITANKHLTQGVKLFKI